MSLYTIQQATLTGIGDAIRAKGGTSESIPVTGLADAITNLPSGGGSGVEIPTVFNCTESRYLFAGDKLKFLLDVHPTGIIEFKNGNSTEGMVRECSGDYSRFKAFGSALVGPLGEGSMITHLPDIGFNTPNSNAGYQYFKSMPQLRNIQRDFFYKTDRTTGTKTTTMSNAFCTYAGMYNAFYGCNNLRTLPEFPKTMTNDDYGYYQAYTDVFSACRSLDKIEGLPVAIDYAMTENQFYTCFGGCYRLSEVTFGTNNGTPYKVSWSNQTIDLSSVGFGFRSSYCNEYNGLSKDDERIMTASGWINENIHIERPDDWWASESTYGRYNHDSAVRTINSLPDCSSGSNNIIKFRRDSGYATGPNANNSCGALTDAEIAVATSKGWTVTFYG